MREATRHAGILRDDPMMPLLTALANAIRYLGARTSQSDRIADQASRRTLEAIQQARANADAETLRFQAELAKTEADFIRRVGASIASSADEALTRRVRVLDRNSILIAAAVLVGTAGACLGGGYWWGSSNARAGFHETEVRLQAAFSNGPDDAKLWLDLMNWNTISVGLRACSKPGVSAFQDGRRGCAVPLWIEAPLPSAPDPQG